MAELQETKEVVSKLLSKETPFEDKVKVIESTVENDNLDQLSDIIRSEVEDELERLALVVAGEQGKIEIIKLLLKAGVNVNCTDKHGNTALILAASEGQDKCVDFLIESGADVNLPNEVECTALFMASGLDFVSGKMGFKNITRSEERQSDRNINCVQSLIQAGADVNTAGHHGSHSLRYAVEYDQYKIVDLLIKAGADVNATDDNGGTALMEASENGYDNCVKLLLDAGADVNQTDVEGCTALHYAAGYSFPESEVTVDSYRCVVLLLQAGAQVNIVNGDGCNALKCHVVQLGPKDSEVVLLLFAAGETTDDNMHEKFEGQADMLENIFSTELRLKHMCRKAIRKHLIDLDPHTNLFVRIPLLGFPSLLTGYLLFNLMLDNKGNDDNGN